MRLKLNRQVIVFILVGVLNTGIDLSVYIAGLSLTDSIILANILATSMALLVSYILNRKFTFQNQTRSARSFILFVGGTLFGLWVLQTAAIYGFSFALHPLLDARDGLLYALPDTIKTLIPKLLATSVSLTWNYIWYSRVVFKTQEQ